MDIINLEFPHVYIYDNTIVIFYSTKTVSAFRTMAFLINKTGTLLPC